MIVIIMGARRLDRDRLGKRVAEFMGWEFASFGSLHCSEDNVSPVGINRTDILQSLATKLESWTYQWRDVVVSFPILSEGDRRQLCKENSLVRIVCLRLADDGQRNNFVVQRGDPEDFELTVSGGGESKVDETLVAVDSQSSIDLIDALVVKLILSTSNGARTASFGHG